MREDLGGTQKAGGSSVYRQRETGKTATFQCFVESEATLDCFVKSEITLRHDSKRARLDGWFYGEHVGAYTTEGRRDSKPRNTTAVVIVVAVCFKIDASTL